MQRWLYIAPLVVAGLAFFLPMFIPALQVPLLPHPIVCYVVGTVLLALGMAFSIWARMELGRNWSNVVTVKVGHELIQSGPYRWVRHPIYTGILTAIIGTGLAQDYLFDLLVPLTMFSSFWIKLKREEDWMRTQFGGQYDAYMTRTKRLVPFVL